MSKHVELAAPIQEMLKGLDIAANAASGTLGPKGRNVFLDDPMVPRLTNDGKSIVDHISLPDKLQNLGAWVVKNTSTQTNDDAGDGTTTTAVVLQATVHEALKRPENAMDVATSLKEALPGVLKLIKARSRKVEDLKQVALISSESESMAQIIAELVEKVGAKGTIMLEESNDSTTTYDFVNGYEANVGFLSPHFINTKDRAEYKKIPVFCSEKKISNIGDIQRLFEQLKEKNQRQIVIVCEDMDNQILGILVQNKLMRALDILVIRATGPLLQDISSAVGATVVSDSTGVNFDNFNYDDHIGVAQKVVSTEKKTVFVSDAKSAAKQAQFLEDLATNNPNKFEARKALERATKLRGGIAVIRVGSPTTIDLGYLKDKAEDAIHATQAALEEGVVEGGGMCLWRIAREMKPKTIGEEILSKALRQPLLTIIKNTGKELDMGLDFATPNHGYDAKNHRFVDLFAAGIVDPAKVERCAVTNAVINAADFITTHCAIVDYVEPKL